MRGLAVVLLGLGTVALPAQPAPAAAAGHGAVATAVPGSPATADPDQAEPAGAGVVVVGVSGLYWTDVDRSTTPTLWQMVGQGSVGSISVRSANPETCPTDAWLTLSAGRRTLDPDQAGSGDAATDPGDGSTLVPVDCTPLPEVIVGAPGPGGTTAADIAGWASLTAPTTEPTGSYGTPGTVGSRIAEAGACATAVGPGAVLALADLGGHVARYLALPSELDAAALAACSVTVVDMGEPAYDPPDRQAALRELDEVLRRLVDAAPDGGRIVVAGVSDTPVDELGLQVVVDWRADGRTAGWLSSESTRRPGIVTLADLSATVLAVVGGVVDDLDGRPLLVDADRRMSTQRTVENRRYLTELTTIVPRLLPVLLGVVAAGVLIALGAALLPGRRRRARVPLPAEPGPVTRRPVTAVLLLAACTPAGAYLAALSRWWGSAAPTVVAAASTAAAITAVALLVWGLSRLLPQGPWRVGGVAAGLTWLVLTVDGLTGTILQQGSLLGATPTLGARYYGFGNLTFAVYVASALVASGAIASALRRARRGAAVAAVLAVGLVTVVVDGWPAFGADFGGVLAVVPAFAMLLLAVAGVSLTARRVGVTIVLTVVTVAVVAVIDWLGPGAASHLGTFVQRVIDGDAIDLVVAKAAGAWATVANPAGALATVLCAVGSVALVGPERFRPAALRRTYARWPLLAPVVASVVAAALLGALLNDSGIAVAAAVLAAAGTLLAASWCADLWFGVGAADAGSDAPVDAGRLPTAGAPIRRMPGVILATGGGLVAVMLLVAAAVPGPLVAAGDVPRGSGAGVVSAGDPIVVIGTSGVRWQDVSRAETPTLWGMLRDGAAAGGVTAGATGASRRCVSAGWLALSTGRAPVTGERVDGTWSCAPWGVSLPAGSGGALVTGWDGLATLQATSAFRPRLGTLAGSLASAGACSTAVGPGAALVLADSSGAVARYRDLDAALADPVDTFSCPVTFVDAGAAPDLPTGTSLAGTAQVASAGSRREALREVDRTVRQVLAAAPADAVVMVVDVGDPVAGRPSLGAGLVDADDQATLRFLSASSTRWEGVVRLLDVPTTVLAAVGAQNPPALTGSPVSASGRRPSDVATTVDQLAALTVRDHALRGVSGSITTIPLLAALGLLGAAVALGRRRSGPAWASTARRARRTVDALLLVIASMPAGLYLMTTWSWWRADSPTVGMWVSLAVATGIVAGLGALAPWRPTWAGPAVVSGITTAVLTLDALLGTPLHRGGPLGPAVTLGGRYYGFGNPTYSVYVVAMMVTATAVATWLLRRGRRRAAVLAATAVAGVGLLVDLWPTLGADVGGGLVLVPACAVIVLAVAGIRMTWQRLGLISAAGLVVVGGIGLIDWLRPAADRSHLGRFVQSVMDGTAGETVARKAGYAAATVTSGPTAWLTLVLLLATGLMLWRRARVSAAWFERVEQQWPQVRPLLLALMVAAVGGAVVNDYGVRIVTMMMFGAVPLLGMLAVRSIPDDGVPSGVPEPPRAVRSPGAAAAVDTVDGPTDGPTDGTERNLR